MTLRFHMTQTLRFWSLESCFGQRPGPRDISSFTFIATQRLWSFILEHLDQINPWHLQTGSWSLSLVLSLYERTVSGRVSGTSKQVTFFCVFGIHKTCWFMLVPDSTGSVSCPFSMSSLADLIFIWGSGAATWWSELNSLSRKDLAKSSGSRPCRGISWLWRGETDFALWNWKFDEMWDFA